MGLMTVLPAAEPRPLTRLLQDKDRGREGGKSKATVIQSPNAHLLTEREGGRERGRGREVGLTS